MDNPFHTIKVLRLDDDIDIIYATETDVIGSAKDFILLLAEPHLANYIIRSFSITMCDDPDPSIDEAFDKLCGNCHDAEDFKVIWNIADKLNEEEE